MVPDQGPLAWGPRPEGLRGGTDGQTDRRTDRQNIPCFLQDIVSLGRGRCPKKRERRTHTESEEKTVKVFFLFPEQITEILFHSIKNRKLNITGRKWREKN